MRTIYTLLILILVVASSCQTQWTNEEQAQLETAFNKAGENRVELEKALEQAPKEHRKAVLFLVTNMPERDLTSLTADFILENTRVAYQAREQFAWCQALPDSVFFNEVLPYASLNERRDNWRQDFLDRFTPLVANCSTIFEAVDSVTQNIKDVVKVEYNTKRRKADQSPYESMEQGMASCTGLSILLTDALRAVGIPARIAGTPLWTNMRGNHTWVEVYLDGEWYFTEYYPDELNKSWFLADAGKADPEKPIHGVYATSFKQTGLSYPCVWDEDIQYIPGENVTARYIRLYEEQVKNSALNDDELLVDFVLYLNQDTTKGDNRVSDRVEIWQGDKNIDFGYSPSTIDDLNKFLKFKLKKNSAYTIRYADGKGGQLEENIETGNQAELVKLYQE
ncbi:transglutaminase-like domain-containing protein [uncultured Sunxiuqinia sp.]|uniref:transglutaminase-like domain-containing protein n=1 Tax=uncultured Sunxiuqinia sp. TaxID=1573825 RepID=UPI00262DE911|nr:transglutaminase-like domain-containing protein [uncultured Sunxiuqinia sp.]